MDITLIITYVLVIIAAYLIGSFPTGFLVVKQLTGQDLRTIGSGSTGATNVRRAAGKKAALFVLFVDLHKGLIPVLISKMILPDAYILHCLAAAFAVIGHSRSIFLNFKGGKSAATGLGGMLGLDFLPALGAALVAFGVTKLSKYQSAGSLAAAVAAPLLLWWHQAPIEYIVYVALAGLYVIYLHKANIVRLIQGTESQS